MVTYMAQKFHLKSHANAVKPLTMLLWLSSSSSSFFFFFFFFFLTELWLS